MEIDRSEASKAFFFEKKKQKTFVSAVADSSGERATAESKVFWSFFSKRTACFLQLSIKAGWYRAINAFFLQKEATFYFFACVTAGLVLPACVFASGVLNLDAGAE